MNRPLIDRRFRPNLAKYVFQCLLATGVILFALIAFDILKTTAIIATVGSSAFIVFTMPGAKTARTRNILGGYAVGMGTGISLDLLARYLIAYGWDLRPTEIVFASVAVGLAIFLMVVFDVEHPPSAGAAMGFVINEWDARTVIFILLTLLIFVLTKRFLRNYLIDLR
ncbi:MAG: hypothetical protein PWP37_747 [Thermotogota bacterium]|nr:hypothetical protein [Thermotogota bacterium]HCZ06320.1 hypothetical protein [Thermotogota bacterium]